MIDIHGLILHRLRRRIGMPEIHQTLTASRARRGSCSTLLKPPHFGILPGPGTSPALLEHCVRVQYFAPLAMTVHQFCHIQQPRPELVDDALIKRIHFSISTRNQPLGP
jgi:hypothetical protein